MMTITFWKIAVSLFAITISSMAYTAQTQQPTPGVQRQVGALQVQFDFQRVEQPFVIQNTSDPFTWRAYIPVCPPGSTYVSGASPHLVELDYPPNFPYCNCICKGNCSGLKGITSTGGRAPLYKTTVTCATKVNGWFDQEIFSPAKTSYLPHQFSYCQSGDCTNKPLPAYLGYSVPTGGFANTVKIDFEACSSAISSQCGMPDQTAPSRN